MLMKTLFQNAFVPYIFPGRAFIFFPMLTQFYIFHGFNFLHFACGRLPKGTIEKRREEKRRETCSEFFESGFYRKISPP